MDTPDRKLPPVVRLPPRSNLDMVLSRGAHVATILLGLLAVIYMLKAGRFLLAPFTLAIVVGLMLGPVATRLERKGLAPAISAVVAVAIFLVAIAAFAVAVATPLSSWAGRLPQIWNELQFQLSGLREPLNTLRGVRDQIREITGGANVTVSVEDGSTVQDMVVLAPTLIAQVLIFLATLYFFLATRHETRVAILRLCADRRLRWRVAHIFRDVEEMVSNYLLSITLINAGLGLAVGLALWLAGLPSPALWGAMAGLLNFIIYIGPAVMAVILFGVGLATFDTLAGSLMPPLVYLTINAVEAQFVTPMVIGRRMTLNPFLIFLAVAFWLWLWGPTGGFVAIPALLIVHVVASNVLPSFHWLPWKATRRLP